eukprot:4754575-Ditylum_brightwellii.AAC.1
MYDRMTELLELATDIQTCVKGIFGCDPENDKGENKYRWQYRLNIIGLSRPQELFHLPKHEI